MAGTGGRGGGGAGRRPPRTVPLCAAEATDAGEPGRGRRRQKRRLGATAPQAEGVGLSRRRLRALLRSGHAGGAVRSAGQPALPSAVQVQLDLSSRGRQEDECEVREDTNPL